MLDINEGDKISFWMLADRNFDISRFSRIQKIKIFGFKNHISITEDNKL